MLVQHTKHSYGCDSSVLLCASPQLHAHYWFHRNRKSCQNFHRLSLLYSPSSTPSTWDVMWVMEEYYLACCWMTGRASNFSFWLHCGCASDSMWVIMHRCLSHLKRDPVPVHYFDGEWIHIFKCFPQFGPFASMLTVYLSGKQTGCKALCFGIFQLWLRGFSMAWRVGTHQHTEMQSII